jgi:signal transduction histidine kinase
VTILTTVIRPLQARWRRLSLTSKLTLLFTTAVILVVTVLGLYFDHFIRASFLETTQQQMDHGFKRLAFNLQVTERELQEAAHLLRNDQLMIASIQLINNYQDKNNYNVYLIDEEKKRIAAELLNRVKLSFKSGIALYDQNNELIAYAKREGASYRLGYVSFAGGQMKLHSHLEGESEYSLDTTTLNRIPSPRHTAFYSQKAGKQGSEIIWLRQSDNLVIKAHLSLFDSVSGKPIAHVEISDLLDAPYFERLSHDLDLNVTAKFDQRDDGRAARLDVKTVPSSLNVLGDMSDYLCVLKRETQDGPVFFIARLPKTRLNAALDANRRQLLIILGIVALAFSLAVRYQIKRSATRPLGTLMAQISKIEHQDYSHSSPLATGDELETISININRLASTVQEREASLAAAHDAQHRLNAELEQERDKLEEKVKLRTLELEQAKEVAEAASRAKSTFLANMSHELRTPLNGIMGMTAMALRRSTDAKQIDQLSKVTQASQHLLRVINDILDISKIEADRLTLEQVSFKLGEVMENIMSMIADKAREKGLRLLFDLSPEVARQSLLGDPLRLGQILINLTGNAVKFTSQGSIIVRARIIDESATNVLIRFEVQDTGIGIAPEDQKRLFTAFEQADGSMTRKYGGTGLGLAISKRLAHLMGGEVGVESAAGQGSTFWSTARFGKVADSPASTSAIAQDVAEVRLKTEFAGTRILLVEDEPINQEVSRSLLEDVGLTVDLAEDGVHAVAMARRNRYGLILMDMQMPNLNGVDATRAIRDDSLNRETPILAMTANAMDEDRQVCLEAGMNDHIGKPVDPVRLFEAMLKWLS